MIFSRVLILSFCSMCYQLLMARAMAEISNQYIISYSLAFAFFLLGMGVGSLVYGKYFQNKNPLTVFLYIEMLLSLIGGLSVFSIYCLFIYMNISGFSDLHSYFTKAYLLYGFLSITPFFIFVIGLLSGFELPIWLKINKNKKLSLTNNQLQTNKTNCETKKEDVLSPSASKEGFLLGSSYIGTFLSSVIVTLIMAPVFGLILSATLVGFINLFVLLESLISYRQVKKSFFILISAGVLYYGGSYQDKLMQIYLKTNYLELELSDFSLSSLKQLNFMLSDHPNILRIRSVYQNIDIIPKNFLEKRPFPHLNLYGKGLAMYLNKQPQFFSNYWETYHESMLIGGVLLAQAPEPKDILILGGGDGLLAFKIFKFFKNIHSVTLVEIDPTMIDLANNHIPIRRMNAQALKNEKLSIVTEDAFTYVEKIKRKYDAIFIDFPFPKTFDLSRLYSVEFYKKIKQLLRDKAFIVIDAPIWKSLDDLSLNVKPMPQDILYSTLMAAGYKNIIAFGKAEPFIFFQKEGQKTPFTQEQKSQYPILKKTSENLKIIDDIVKDVEIKKEYVNSVFKPVRFRY